MITRHHCEKVARDWVFAQGNAELHRRMESIRRGDEEMMQYGRDIGQPLRVDYVQRIELAADMCRAHLDGYYDPPMPAIPGFFTRLRLHDWSPPQPTAQQWPMGSAEQEQDG